MMYLVRDSAREWERVGKTTGKGLNLGRDAADTRVTQLFSQRGMSMVDSGGMVGPVLEN